MAEATPEDRLIDHILDYPEESAPQEEETPPQEAAEDENEPIEASDEGEPEEVTEDLPEDEFISLEYEGVEYEIPKALEKGFSQERDYTTKSQALADSKREVEFTQKQMDSTKAQYDFAQSIQNELVQIAQIDDVLNRAGNLDWSGMSTDEMVRTRHEMDQVEKQKKALVEGLSLKQTDFQEAQQQAQAELLEKGAEVLKQSIPGWNEEKQKEMRGYAINDGYSEAEVAGVTDPRFVRTLWKAAQFDKIQKGAKDGKVAIKSAPTIKARSRKEAMSKEKGRELNLRKKLNNPNTSSAQKEQAMIDSGVIMDRFG